MVQKSKTPATARPHGVIKWRPAEASQVATVPVQRLADLLQQFSAWPPGEFARGWLPGDYKLLNVTCARPQDLEVVVVGQSSAGSDIIDVTVGAKIRSKGRPRQLRTSEHEALASVGFGTGSEGRAELLHRRNETRPDDLAARILTGMRTAFGITGPTVLKYSIRQDSRLDEMRVHQNIRVYELTSLLRAAGFHAQTAESVANPSAVSESEPGISVAGRLPFTIALREYDESGFLTLKFEALVRRELTPTAVNELNRQLLVGTAVLLEDGALQLRYNLCVSGGLSHAAIRHRIYEWVAALKQASGEKV
jgi:hypothetical protein